MTAIERSLQYLVGSKMVQITSLSSTVCVNWGVRGMFFRWKNIWIKPVFQSTVEWDKKKGDWVLTWNKCHRPDMKPGHHWYMVTVVPTEPPGCPEDSMCDSFYNEENLNGKKIYAVIHFTCTCRTVAANFIKTLGDLFTSSRMLLFIWCTNWWSYCTVVNGYIVPKAI